MTKRTALVVGATGLIGKELVMLLIENPQYERVEIWVRRSSGFKHPKLTERMINFDSLQDIQIETPFHDVFCCLGTTIKKAKTKDQFKKVDLEYPLELARFAKNNHAEHLLVISAIGANAGSSIFYNHVKGQLERELQALTLPQLSIFRPSILLGKREEFRFGERLGIMAVSLMRFLLLGKLKRYRGIKASDVAKAMVIASLKQPKQPVTIYESEEIAKLSLEAI
ncbi:uncharacterized protein YbjT [Bacillus oleivorans]|uniref:Uncharacterized protein YbjT n=1 Tax=Bacillus oleivorans TaxID=1448271 RepID=A0A285CH91_9BACI|nr:oxidoreductase [Bacillus oleivorans]SNX66869.1 uncharacterized protein YbjT [Bacillus oleivorans]